MVTKLIEFICENWFFIVVAIGIAIYVYEEIARRTNEEKIAIAKRLILMSMDAIVAEAEMRFADYEKSGQLKRSYVIQTIFDKYPVLNGIVEQEALLDWIDKLIKESVERLKEASISKIERK